MSQDTPSAERTNLILSLLVVAGIAGVAYADSLVATISLAYLYLLPLALSALIHRLRTSLVLSFLCVVLHDWFGPFEHVGWQHIVRNLLAAVGFASVVLFVNQLARQRTRLGEIVRKQRDELEKEIELAAEVQQRLLPSRQPDVKSFDIAGYMHASKIVGGDYYDYVELPGGDVGLAIADVSGKGVPAALLMPTVQTALRIDAPSLSRTDELAQALNKIIYEITDETRYITLFYGKLNTRERSMQYTNAGHPPPLLLRASARDVLWLGKGGPVLGLLPEAEYEHDTVRLHPGDLVVLYTDGVVEARNAKEEEYSRQRLVALLSSHAGKSAQKLVEIIHADVTEFRGAGPLEDDLSLVVLKVVGEASD